MKLCAVCNGETTNAQVDPNHPPAKCARCGGSDVDPEGSSPAGDAYRRRMVDAAVAGWPKR